MGNFPSSGLKDLFEDVISNENKPQEASLLSSGTPDRMTLLDPRSPLVDVDRTPIEVLFKSVSLTDMCEKTDEVVTDETHQHKRQLNDPRSATAGIARTPIVVESPSEVRGDDTATLEEDDVVAVEARGSPKPATLDTPVRVCDMVQKVAKKLTFDLSPSPRKGKTAAVTLTARSRTPLAQVGANTPARSRGGRHSRRSSAKAQGPMSPLQLLHVRQRLAVRRALQLTRGRLEAENAENCPPASNDSAYSEPPVQPVKVSAVLPAKDPALRF